jgi:hypothetical protein
MDRREKHLNLEQNMQQELSEDAFRNQTIYLTVLKHAKL